MRATLTTLLTAVIFTLSISASFANNNPEGIEPNSNFSTYYASANVDLMVDVTKVDIFKAVSYADDSFSIQTLQTISFVQLLNPAGDLEFQMPIGSDSVHLSLENFESGEYYFNILLEGGSEMTSTLLSIK